jgi:hypothetical protein
LTKSDIGVTSPTEKTEFIMPKSLSEELTKEMQEASRKKELEESSLDTGTKNVKEVNRTAWFICCTSKYTPMTSYNFVTLCGNPTKYNEYS